MATPVESAVIQTTLMGEGCHMATTAMIVEHAAAIMKTIVKPPILQMRTARVMVFQRAPSCYYRHPRLRRHCLRHFRTPLHHLRRRRQRHRRRRRQRRRRHRHRHRRHRRRHRRRPDPLAPVCVAPPCAPPRSPPPYVISPHVSPHVSPQGSTSSASSATRASCSGRPREVVEVAQLLHSKIRPLASDAQATSDRGRGRRQSTQRLGRREFALSLRQ